MLASVTEAEDITDDIEGDLLGLGPPQDEAEGSQDQPHSKDRKFSDFVRQKVFPSLTMKSYARSSSLLVDGDSQDFSPATAAWFLGPKAENEKLLKELVLKCLDEHRDFRKYKHFPLDPKYITKTIKKEQAFTEASQSLTDSLEELCQRLKNSVPFSNFRFQGQMVWDTTIASNVGYIAALLYNQNNVASMASGVTLQLEREVATDLCRMVGYNVRMSSHTTDNPQAWGHLPNGGTVANLEAMWAARSVKFNGLTIKKMLKMKKDESEVLNTVYRTFTYIDHQKKEQRINEANGWQLLNLPIDEGIDLFNNLLSFINQTEEALDKDLTTSDEIFSWVKKYTLESLGVLNFYGEFREELAGLNLAGVWICPGSRHYSWDKGANILGIGRDNLIKIPVDRNCRMRMDLLRSALEECLERRRAVIGVTVVYGTTQEGAVDDMEQVLKIREEFLQRGLSFTIHIDAAWGGYFASCIDMSQDHRRTSERKESGSECFDELRLSSYFEKQLRLMRHANSITLDPHKSGFCPYPAGGLLYRNGNIRHFLAQKAAYVAHGSKNNEEINLYGIDGSKPGAASAGVWLSHKVTGLHHEGYGLLLRQSNFSAGVMYTMWISLGRERDPFIVLPCIPLPDKLRARWPNTRIRKEILFASNKTLNQNVEAREFLRETGPDTLINCLSINFRTWDSKTGSWVTNTSMKKQGEFLAKLMKRCSHSYEKPSMVDRGIQIILNSSAWELETHKGVYRAVKEQMGLSEDDSSKLGVILNTCMSPWIRSQKTFQRISTIIRNELYNAYGAMTDEPVQLRLVSPCILTEDWTGSLYAELEASFACPSLRYHCVGQFMFSKHFLWRIRDLEERSRAGGNKAPLLRMKTVRRMKVYDLMTGGAEGEKFFNMKSIHPDMGNMEGDTEDRLDEAKIRPEQMKRQETVKDKIDRHNDNQLTYENIAMPEVLVDVFFGNQEDDCVRTSMKLKRVMRYHHLTRDFVDETDYPPTQEYFLYASQEKAYLSHCPNRYPDFQQLIQLDNIPLPDEKAVESKKNDLYKEALERGVVVYLPEISCGGRPTTRRKDKTVCKDPIKHHSYNAISWSDQGAFTGQMTSIHLTLSKHGVRWFDGKKINHGYEEVKVEKFGYLLQDNSDDSDSFDELDS